MLADNWFVRFSNMSRMIKKQLPVLEGISFENHNGNLVVSNGAKKIEINLNKKVKVDFANGLVFTSLENEDNGMLGTAYVLVKNAMQDLKQNYTAKLKMIGVGFKASVAGKILRTYIGLSHDVCFLIPEGLSVAVANDVEITITGNNRSEVMQFAKTIRNMKKPEPYKGKGIFLNDEKVMRKEGKKK